MCRFLVKKKKKSCQSSEYCCVVFTFIHFNNLVGLWADTEKDKGVLGNFNNLVCLT